MTMASASAFLGVHEVTGHKVSLLDNHLSMHRLQQKTSMRFASLSELLSAKNQRHSRVTTSQTGRIMFEEVSTH